jgi:hypothetical protein
MTSYPLSPIQRIALERAIHTLEDETRAAWLLGDKRGEEAAAARDRGNHGLADDLRRAHDRHHRHAEELRRVENELSNAIPTEGP